MIIKNIKKFIDSKELKVSFVEKFIGVANGTLSKPIKNKKSIKTETLEKFLKFFPEINPVWLLTGNGQMLGTSDSLTSLQNLEDLISLQREKIQTLEKELKELKKLKKEVNQAD